MAMQDPSTTAKAQVDALVASMDPDTAAEMRGDAAPVAMGTPVVAPAYMQPDEILKGADGTDKPKKGALTRARRVAIFRSYAYDKNAAHMAGAELTEDEWRDVVLATAQRAVDTGFATSVMLVFHDRDPLFKDKKPVFQADGVTPYLKDLHAHAVVNCTNPQTFTGITKMFGLSGRRQNVGFIRRKAEYIRRCLYLTHSNAQDRAEGKYEYDIGDVHVFAPAEANPEAWYRGIRAGRVREDDSMIASNRERFEDRHATAVSEGRETVADVVRLVRTDKETQDLLDCGTDLDYATRIESKMTQESRSYMRDLAAYFQTPGVHRCLVTTYIKAPGNSGKSELAMAAASRFCARNGSRLGVQIIPASGGKRMTFDPAGNYEGQIAAVGNEFNGAVVPLDLWKDMLNPITPTVVNSRNTDKFWGASRLYLTSSIAIEEQIKACFMNYARSVMKKGAEVEGTADDGGMTSADWDKFYMSRPDVADQICQLRRRFAVVVEIIANGDDRYAVINVRNDDRNKATFKEYARPVGTDFKCIYGPGVPEHPKGADGKPMSFHEYGAWSTYAIMRFDPDDADVMGAVVDAMEDAARFYHAFNHYRITPDNTPAAPALAAWRDEQNRAVKSA